MQLQKAIEDFGYKPHEAKVYLTVLDLGECTVTDISLRLKLPRTSVQMAVDKLHSDGLLNFYVRKRYKRWVAENPDKLLAMLQERESDLREVMPQLSAIRHEHNTRPSVKIFMGAEEIKLIHKDMIETKKGINGIIPGDNWIDLFGQSYIDDFIATRVAHFLKIRLLTPRGKWTETLKESDPQELRHTRFLPESIPIENAIYTYGNKVAIITLNRSMPTGILIEDEGTHRTLEVLFELLWNRSDE